MEGNTKKARTLFTKSCDMGEEYSSCNFVDALNGYEDSILELVNIYKYTCEVGEVLYACNMLSKFKNSNDPKIKKIAKQQSCKSKNFKDCFDLGNIEYNRGNIGLAIKYYKKSCIGEYMKGCVNLGSIEYNRGRLANARRYYSKACDNNENIACTKLFDINNRVPSGSKK